MILTVTLNSALDRIFFIEEWTPGLPIRIDQMVTAVGGKGLDAAVSLRCQGIPAAGLTFVAGAVGQELVALLDGYGMKTIPIWVEGETRVAHVVAERTYKRHTHLIAGQMGIRPAHLDALFERLASELRQSSWMVGGGSLPKNVDTSSIARTVELANAAGVPSLIDTSALPIEPIMRARPTILKINEVEFAAAFALQIPTPDTLLQEGQRVMESCGLENLVVTCGEKGLYALTAEGVFHAQAPPQIAVNAAGAGDAIAGTLPYRLAQGDSWAEALRYATAVSAATVLTEATAECRMADVERILPSVKVMQLRERDQRWQLTGTGGH